MVPISGNAPDSLRYECSASLSMLNGLMVVPGVIETPQRPYENLAITR